MINRTISNFKILEKLGEGGMGVVYKAEDTNLKRKVALKFLSHQVSVKVEEKERLKIEAQAAAALNHPNICTIHEIYEADEQSFIVMEYIGTEEKPAPLLKDAHMDDPEKVWSVIKQNISKMYHQARLVHADLSEYNVLYHEEPVIIDVGQTVKLDNPMAETFLRRDIDTLTYFFNKFFSVSATEVYEEIVAEDS